MRKPSYAIPILVCLTLGTAAVVTTTSLVASLVWPRSPYPHAASLFEAYEDRLSVTASDHDRFISDQTRADFTTRSGATRSAGVRLLGTPLPGELAGCGSPVVATGEFFSVLVAAPFLGRLFAAADESSISARPVVISHDCWINAFAGDSAAVGRSFARRGDTYTVVGILPPGFGFPIQSPARTYVLANSADKNIGFDFSLVRVVEGNLPRANAAAAVIERVRGPLDQAELRSRTRSTRLLDAGGTPPPRFVFHPYRGEPLDATSQRLVGLILFCALLVALVTMSNSATLCAARMTDRGRDFAMRLALGASRPRVLIGVLAEGYTFVVIAGVFGGGLSTASLSIIGATLPLTRSGLEVTLRFAPFIATLGSLALLWTIFAIFATRGASGALTSSLRASENASTATPRLIRMQRRAVMAQVAITIAVVCVWVLAAFEFFSSAQELRATTRGILVAVLSDSPDPTDSPRDVNPIGSIRFAYDNLRRTGLRVAIGQHPARAQIRLRQVRPSGGAAASFPVWLAGTSSTYENLLHDRVSRGRSFTEAEERAGARVAIINQQAVNTLFGDSDPIGKSLQVEEGTNVLAFTVIGVSSGLDVLRSISGEGRALEVRVPWTTLPEQPNSLILAASGSERSLESAMRSAAPPGTKIRIERAEDLVAGRGALHRLLAQLFTLFGCAALGLTAVGTYSLMAMTAVQLRRAVAIRLALGAAPRRLIWWLLRRHSVPVLLGMTAGLALTTLAAILGSKLGLISPDRANPLTLMAATAATVGLVLAASLLPAHSSVARPIMDTLRED